MRATMVPLEHVEAIWPDVRGFFVKTAEYTYGRFEVDDMLDAVLQYDHHLWVAYDDGVLTGAVITRFNHYPRMKCLDMVFTGGRRLDQWKDVMLDLLQCWAVDNDCECIESTGRPGWAKIFQDDGHKLRFHVYELPVAKLGLGGTHG